MPALRAVLFDLDGTLIDTAPDFAFVLNRLLERHGRPPIPYERVRQTVSDGSGGLITLGFGLRPAEPEFEPMRQALLSIYAEHLADESRLFEGMEAVLQRVENTGLKWGLVTNKPSAYAGPLVQALGLAERCATLVCPDHVRQRKPHPEALLLACAALDCKPADAIYVGDHRRDIEAAQQARMRSVACTYGYVHEDDPCSDWGADHLVASPAELLALIDDYLATHSDPA